MEDRIEIGIIPLTLMDSEDVYDLFNNDKVLQSYPKKPIETKEQAADFIKRLTASDCWTWKITFYGEDALLGICSLHHLDIKNKTIEIGGTLLPEYWGKGIMASAFRMILERARLDFKVEKVIGRTLSFNTQAIHLVKKMGFEVLSTDNTETVLLKYLSE